MKLTAGEQSFINIVLIRNGVNAAYYDMCIDETKNWC